LAGILSLLAVVLFIDTFKGELKTANKQKWFILLSLFTWLAVFNGIRYSSENVSAKLFLIGFCLLFWPRFRRNALGYLIIGFLLGFAFVTRYQTGFMLVGLMAWLLFIQRLKLSAWVLIIIGIALAIAGGLSIDHWFYGDWVLTPWRYFAANILQGKADSFSVDPWYMYLSIAGLVPYGLLYIPASLYFIVMRRKHVISWVMAPFIVGHLLVGHKELRF
jgi:phosphatidylinositol glycan class B